jgi:hypothetical protein
MSTVMISTEDLARAAYTAWREAAPMAEDLGPEWNRLAPHVQARWRHVAEAAFERMRNTIGAA